MQLANIKKRIIKNKNVLKITSSLKIMSMTKLKGLKEKEQTLDENINELENIFKKKFKISLSKNTDINQEIREYKHFRKIGIFLFTDMSFCGTLNNKNQIMLSDNQTYKDFVKVFIIGNKGKVFPGDFIGKLYDKNLLNSLWQILLKKFRSNNHTYQIDIYIGNKVVNLKYMRFDNLLKQEYFNGYFKYTLYKTILNFQEEECKTRLMQVLSAIKNSEELNHTLTILYNKTRQQIVTGEMLEILSSNKYEE